MPDPGNSPKHWPVLIGTAIFAMVWVVVRACVQSLTIDEADTYLYFVGRSTASYWTPSANNHLLNSMLMKLSTLILGTSALTLRLPALLGAALYIGAVYGLVRLSTGKRLLQWAWFVCLVLSPFVMDYLVAARGYGLASAFLVWTVLIGARHQARDEKSRALDLRRTCILMSVSAALSICANFSFAVADALVLCGLLLWIGWEHRRDALKILGYATLPGLAVGCFFVLTIVLGWPKSEFTWGSDSLVTTIKSLVRASLFQPSEYLLNPKIQHYFVHFGRFLYPALAVLVLWRVVMLLAARQQSGLAAVCGAALMAALAVHQILFWRFRILLPLDRTAMWVVLLFLVMAGALAAAPPGSAVGRASGNALAAILVLIACYNLGCLRLTYFNEWKWDSDMKNVYKELSYYNHAYGLTKISTNWRYVSALNCYRLISGHETMEAIPGAPTEVDTYPEGYQIYVFYFPWDLGFVEREGLRVVYHDEFSGAAIGIRPDALPAH